MTWRHLRLLGALSPLLLACAHVPTAPPAPLLADIRTVEAWGGSRADATFRARARAHQLSRLTLHQGGVPFGRDRDPVAHLRQLQRWSRQMRGWADIPYHFVIDLEGTIYEARDLALAGDTNTAYDPSGHALVMLLGNFEEVEPTAAQIDATVRLFAALAERYSIPTATVASHRDYAADTVCPGQHLYTWIRSGLLRQRVEALRVQP